MQCENCGQGNFERDQVVVDVTTRKFIGPCCAIGQTPAPTFGTSTQWQYGVEVSSTDGFLAYANRGGFQLSFQKKPEEIQAWFQQRRAARGLRQSAA